MEGLENIDRGKSYDGDIDFGNGNVFKCTEVFWKNYFTEEDIVINQGGTDSGKTFALIQLLFTIAVLTTPPENDATITVVGESVPNLKKGAWRIAKDIYNNHKFLKEYVKGDWNETDRMIFFKNGWVMEFNSYEDEQSAKQGKRQHLFINEAQAIDWNIFWQLCKKTRGKVFIDFNPTAPFWVCDNLIGTTKDTNDFKKSVKLIISNHWHNRFLTDVEHERTEGIKDTQRFLVYARGLFGNLSGLIYTNWVQCPNEEFPLQKRNMFWGIDLGFSSDPTAIVRMVRVGNIIYVDEVSYETGANPTFIHQKMVDNGYKPNQKAYSDHKPEVLAGLRRKNVEVFNALKDVNAGIMKVQEFEIHYTARSVNVDYERKRYMWINDPMTGKPTNKPIEKPAHAMKAIQYGIYTFFYRG